MVSNCVGRKPGQIRKERIMLKTIRKSIAHPALAIGSTLIWGVLELVALQRANKMSRATQRRGSRAALLGMTDHHTR